MDTSFNGISEVKTARQRFQEEGGGVVLSADTWACSPEFRCLLEKGDHHSFTTEDCRQATGCLPRGTSSLPENHDTGVHDHEDMCEDPWYPDGFKLLEAEDEREPAGVMQRDSKPPKPHLWRERIAFF
jgi:hypothetical protein